MPLAEIETLGERLRDFHQRYRRYLRTQTRDTSIYGYWYISGLLRMDARRNMANIGRKTAVPVQNMQHFLSNSPWSGRELIAGVQQDVKAHEAFREEAVLVFDESADEKAGEHSAGSGRQHNGRLGKVEMSQVGVFASLVTPWAHTWIDGELFIPQHWFSHRFDKRRKRAGIPDDRTFQTKPQLVWQMVERLQEAQIPFGAVAMDTLYGRSALLRSQLDAAGIEYYADVPATTRVYLSEPQIVHPQTKWGRPSKNPTVVSTDCYQVRNLLNHPDMEWQTIELRPFERGFLTADFARCLVWTVHEGKIRQEWLLMRRDGKRITYILSNAATDTALFTMAWRKSHRYFIERDNQDVKSELGWDEFQAIKFRAWEHHLALTILASWFMAETRLDWADRFPRDPTLLQQHQIDSLPNLSVANVRELLKATMPLPQLAPDQAAALVVQHLLNRTHSRRSRLRHSGRIRPGLANGSDP